MTGQPWTAIRVRGLRKAYGKQVVLDGVDFEVEPGTVFALLGPNGAGKTTLIQILSPFSRADGGDRRRFRARLAAEPAMRFAR